MTRHEELRRGIELHEQCIKNINEGIEEYKKGIHEMEDSRAYHEQQIKICLWRLATPKDYEIDLKAKPCKE